jgi:hypothetical protein
VRRTVLLALVAGLLVCGCGTERPASIRDGTASTGPAPSQAEPTSTPSTQPTGSLRGFPLALGYDDENGDDHSPVVVTGKPATRAFAECGRTVWDPKAGTTDVLGVEFRGEAEWSRGRTLVLYPSTDAAAAAVETARDVITSCPRDDGDEYGWVEHTLIDYVAGDHSVGWIDRWWSAEVDGFDTGLTVHHVVRVGRAVLYTYEYGEGNGSEQTRGAAVVRAANEDQPVVGAMGRLATEHAPVLTDEGVGPYRIRMSAEELIAAGGPLDSDQADPCSPLAWTGPDGARLKGAFSTGTGLAYLSVEAGVTPEGVTVGTPLADLRTAYPDLAGDDLVATVTLPDTGNYYRFEVDDGRVNWLVLVDRDQQCVS